MISALYSSPAIGRLPQSPPVTAPRSAPEPRPVAGDEARVRRGGDLQGLNRPLVSAGNLVQAQEQSLEVRKSETPKTELPKSDLELSDEDRATVRDMQARDREVRAHEQAHASVGGQYAGSPTYEFERGPDGRSYAVAGQVSISTSPIPNDPQATIDKMDIVKRAALAPADPSGQDRRVAADAEAKRSKAQSELSQIRQDELQAAFNSEEPAVKGGIAAKDGAKGFAEALERASSVSQASSGTRLDGSAPPERDALQPGIDLVA